MLKQSTSGGVQSGWIGHTQDWTRLDWTGVRSCLRLSDLFLSRADIAAEDEYQMSLSMSSVSLLLLPRGVPSLESHSPSSPFTHHEEKIQNMWCASLILQLPYATATSELHVHCHLFQHRHLTMASQKEKKKPPM